MIAKNKYNKGLKSLGDMLSNIAKPILGKRGFVEADIIMKWQEIVGKELSEVTRPQKIVFARGKRDGGVLHIITKGGGEALLLQHREKMVINRINTFFGYRAVERISIVQGYFTENNNDDIVEKIDFDDETILKAKDFAKDIKDDDLATALENLGKAVIKNQGKKEDIKNGF